MLFVHDGSVIKKVVDQKTENIIYVNYDIFFFGKIN